MLTGVFMLPFDVPKTVLHGVARGFDLNQSGTERAP
jgi:hypothetical protein